MSWCLRTGSFVSAQYFGTQPVTFLMALARTVPFACAGTGEERLTCIRFLHHPDILWFVKGVAFIATVTSAAAHMQVLSGTCKAVDVVVLIDQFDSLRVDDLDGQRFGATEVILRCMGNHDVRQCKDNNSARRIPVIGPGDSPAQPSKSTTTNWYQEDVETHTACQQTPVRKFLDVREEVREAVLEALTHAIDCYSGAADHYALHSGPQAPHVCLDLWHESPQGKESKRQPFILIVDVEFSYWLVLLVLTLLAAGCPQPTIVLAFGLVERTAANWDLLAGQHAQQVQQEGECQGNPVAYRVQANDMWLKTQCGNTRLAPAMAVFLRLFIWEAIGVEWRNSLVTRVSDNVAAALHRGHVLLWVTDGFGEWEQAFRHRLRVPLYTGKLGRPRLLPWPELQLVRVVKQKVAGRLVSIEKRLPIGTWSLTQELLFLSQTQLGAFNTATSFFVSNVAQILYTELYNFTGNLPCCKNPAR